MFTLTILTQKRRGNNGQDRKGEIDKREDLTEIFLLGYFSCRELGFCYLSFPKSDKIGGRKKVNMTDLFSKIKEVTEISAISAHEGPVRTYLREKMTKLSSETLSTDTPSSHTYKEEALSALEVLGYPRKVAENVIHKILSHTSTDFSVEELIKQALKQL